MSWHFKIYEKTFSRNLKQQKKSFFANNHKHFYVVWLSDLAWTNTWPRKLQPKVRVTPKTLSSPFLRGEFDFVNIFSLFRHAKRISYAARDHDTPTRPPLTKEFFCEKSHKVDGINLRWESWAKFSYTVGYKLRRIL